MTHEPELNACEQMRALLGDHHRNRLDAQLESALLTHLQLCPRCRQVDAEERVVSELLRTRLPRPAAPASLRATVAAMVAARVEAPANLDAALPAQREPPASADIAMRARAESRTPALPTTAPRNGPPRRRALALGAALSAAAMLLGLGLLYIRGGGADPSDALVAEAVNDHLRVLYASNPLEVQSGGMHQVRPWFTGRLDFAPTLSFDGDAEFALAGGAVGYFVDRKAAVFVFKRRLHTVSLFEFRADGLRWPARLAATGAQSAPRIQVAQARGFQVVLSRVGDLGYALVSDAEPATLLELAHKLGMR